MAKTFNKIAGELEESHVKEENTGKSVDIKVRARTQALEETIDALEQKVRNRTAELQGMIKTLEKFQGESTIKELEVANLRKQIESLEGDVNKKPQGASQKRIKADDAKNKIENT